MPISSLEPIRIAHVVHGLRTGGLEHGLVKLVNALPEGRYRHAVIALTEIGPLAAEVRARGTQFFALRKRAGNDVGAVYRLAALLRALRPHVLRTYAWPTWLEGALAARGAGVRAHIHSEHGRYFYETEAQRARRRIAGPALAALCDAVVAVSADIARDLRASGVPARKVHVIRNGVDTGRFRPAGSPERAWARAALGIEPGVFALGSVGRLVPEKDYRSLVSAAASLANGRDLTLLLAGDGPERAGLEAAIAEAGLGARARLLGARADVPEVLRALDLFVLPSLSEGLSNTLLEAMASGLPVVATRAGGNGEVVRHLETGVLVPEGDASRLAEAIGMLAGDALLRSRLGASGRSRAIEVFSIGAMAARHGALLDRFARLRCGIAPAA